ncbi:GIY-YIG nuclease family protein [Ruegeria arenilitoris]|uniref:GIY-YIG nuclease family protein n=1 Tax=Ruegeria arenilitoris TaxID=1173585 RepID=UPI003464AC52
MFWFTVQFTQTPSNASLIEEPELVSGNQLVFIFLVQYWGSVVPDYSSEDLLGIGFVEDGEWTTVEDELSYQLFPDDERVARALMREPNALYAFLQGENILYIGKITRSLHKRFQGYNRPGKSQLTNIRCNQKIRELLARGLSVRILGFVSVTHFRYGDFEINLAAGLEDFLIRAINPPWNGGDRGGAISETEEREAAEEHPPAAAQTHTRNTKGRGRFPFTLAKTYFTKGIVNVGIEASEHLGDDGEPILVKFSDAWRDVGSRINRTANKSGGVRIVGNNRAIAQWFQRHFNEGDTISFDVIDANTLLFHERSDI